MSTLPIEFHFSYPYLNSARRNIGRSMLYNDVNDLRQAFPAATPMPIQTATMPGPTGQVPMAGLTTPPAGAGPGVRGPPVSQAVPMMPPPPLPQKSGGMLDSLKQHKILVIGAVVALVLIIGIIFLLLRKKKGRRKK